VRLAIINAVLRDVATKGDIESLRKEFKEEIESLKAATKDDVEALRSVDLSIKEEASYQYEASRASEDDATQDDGLAGGPGQGQGQVARQRARRCASRPLRPRLPPARLPYHPVRRR
jgi:hypothetical protein